MNKLQLVKEVARDLNITEKDTKIILSKTFEKIINTVSNGEKVKIVGFGVFEPRNRKQKIGRHPLNSAKEITILAKTVPVFHAGKKFKCTVIEAFAKQNETKL